MCIITMKTQTSALRGKKILEMNGIAAQVVSLDASLTQKGCAYGIGLSCRNAKRGADILRSKGISYGTLIGNTE